MEGTGIENICIRGIYTKSTYSNKIYTKVDIYFSNACTRASIYISDTFIEGANTGSICAKNAYIKGAFVEAACDSNIYIENAFFRHTYIKSAFVGAICVKNTCIGGASAIKHLRPHL